MKTEQLQTMYNISVARMLRQGARSVRRRVNPGTLKYATHGPNPSTSICSYRGVDGLVCAIGALMTDEAYNPTIEGAVVYSSSVLTTLCDSGWDVDRADCDFLARMQQVHDMDLPHLWPAKYKEVARDFELDDSVIDNYLDMPHTIPVTVLPQQEKEVEYND